MSKRCITDKTLPTKVSQTSKDPESLFVAAQNNENSENQPNPFDFMDDSRPIVTFTAKPRMLHPHKRQVKQFNTKIKVDMFNAISHQI